MDMKKLLCVVCLSLMALSLLEPHRFAKIRAYCKGIADGVRMPVKEYRP